MGEWGRVFGLARCLPGGVPAGAQAQWFGIPVLFTANECGCGDADPGSLPGVEPYRVG